MTQKETALARLSGNRLLYIDMLEVLRRGTAQIRRAGPDGVLLYDPPSEVWFLDAETPAAALSGILYSTASAAGSAATAVGR